MTVQQQYNGEKGKFFIKQDEKIVAKMTYLWGSS